LGTSHDPPNRRKPSASRAAMGRGARGLAPPPSRSRRRTGRGSTGVAACGSTGSPRGERGCATSVLSWSALAPDPGGKVWRTSQSAH